MKAARCKVSEFSKEKEIMSAGAFWNNFTESGFGIKSEPDRPLHLPFDQRLPAPGWIWPAFLGACALSCALPRRWGYWRAAIGAPFVLSIVASLPNFDFGDVPSNFVTGAFMVVYLLKWFDLLVIQQPEEEVWRVPENTPDSQLHDPKRACPSPTVKSGVIQKLWWAGSLWTTDRGLGWNWRIQGVEKPVSPGYSRVRFILECIREAFVSSLVIDVVTSVLAASPYSNPLRETWPDLHLMNWMPRTAIVWHVGIASAHGGQLPYSIFAALTVALGICRPEQWPPLYTSWLGKAYSIRQLWGVCWHQHLRHMIKLPGTYFVRYFKISKGTLLSKYGQLYIGFAVSAIAHHAGSYMIHRHSGGMYQLWAYQAMAITFEDLVIWLASRAGIRQGGATKMIGRIWLCLWLSSQFAGIPAASLFMTAGQAANDPHPIGSVLSLFPYSATGTSGAGDFFRLIADRWSLFFILIHASDLLLARSPRGVAKALPAAVLAGACYWASTQGADQQTNVALRAAGVTYWAIDWVSGKLSQAESVKSVKPVKPA